MNRLPADTIDRLATLLRAGVAPHEVAERLHVSRRVVFKYKRRFELPPSKKGRPRIPADVERAIADLATAGWMDRRIGAALGISTATVSGRRKTLADVPRCRSKHNIARIVALLKEGKRHREITSELGVPSSSISRICREQGITPARRGRPRKECS